MSINCEVLITTRVEAEADEIKDLKMKSIIIH